MSTPVRIKVWDLPTRLSHWLLVVFLGVSWWTAETHRMDWHRYSGYVLLGVLLFRIYWGFWGSSTSRFTEFVKGPATVVGYLKGKYQHVIGHNPLGALSVIALLGLVLGQVILGLFAVDTDGIESGPLSYLVSFESGRAMAKLHEQVFTVLQLFVVLHVAAVFGYLIFKRTNLIRPMVTGSTMLEIPPTQPTKIASWWNAIVGIAISSAIVWYVATGG